MGGFHPATSPPPPDLMARFVKTVLELHPEWADFQATDEAACLFRVPGPSGPVELVFERDHPGSMILMWEQDHLHFGFDWHVAPTVETVTREMVMEAERRLRASDMDR